MSTQVTINKSEDSNIFLHPLVIISISDHFTRTKFAINNKDPNPRVVGALIGTQAGRNIEIFRSFEAFLIPGPGGRQLIDKSYLLKKSTQRTSFENPVSFHTNSSLLSERGSPFL
eukprot:TRINITY_DN717_c0_g1_i3.p1 TRINITY_DN717_c0_g1~~TRINITY_DN717_c0_g1_i3.p1  ORF type:complete len:115 (-),score=16.06 TRINITY_DN717_c0_g1_i3:953-1297(-)